MRGGRGYDAGFRGLNRGGGYGDASYSNHTGYGWRGGLTKRGRQPVALILTLTPTLTLTLTLGMSNGRYRSRYSRMSMADDGK